MHPQTSGDYASTSYGLNPTVYYGRVESIDDPHNRNRCQIRMFGYEDDKGNIPNNKLEWMHASMQNSRYMVIQKPSHIIRDHKS